MVQQFDGGALIVHRHLGVSNNVDKEAVSNSISFLT